MSESGHDNLLPKNDEVLSWLGSQTADKTYKTLFAIELIQHGIWSGPGGLNNIYYDAKVAKLKPEEQLEWLKEQMPIKDIHHAIFIPKIKKLLIDDKFFLDVHRDRARESLEQKAKEDYDLVNFSHVDYNGGVIATIKENGWKIFHVDRVTETELLPASAEGLAEQGYLLMDTAWQGKEHSRDGKLDLITTEPIVPADQE